MAGWMERRIDRWIGDGLMDRCMDGWVYGRKNGGGGSVDRLLDRWKDGKNGRKGREGRKEHCKGNRH